MICPTLPTTEVAFGRGDLGYLHKVRVPAVSAIEVGIGGRATIYGDTVCVNEGNVYALPTRIDSGLTYRIEIAEEPSILLEITHRKEARA